MTLDLVFNVSMALCGFGWLLLFAVPYKSVAKKLVHSGLVPLLISVIYSSFFFWDAAQGQSRDGSFWSLDGVQALFSHREVVLVGWIHYMAFDMFVGAWATRDARRMGMHRAILVPCQFLILMLGPFGFFLYTVFRGLLCGQFRFEED
ncbi:MAG: ABA4-like family protein, partial [Planctomycetota bacterium]|nr:ABA4-like family protein [Planctomycetota bacterium]